MKNKNLWLWALYDFANSIVFMGFLFYFSQWLVIDHGKPAWWYNATLIISSVLFIISAPAISKKIDTLKIKINGLRFWTILAFVGYLLVALIATMTEGMELLATVLFTLAAYAYLVSFLYYTPMLSDLSAQNDRSWKSGVGQAANNIGQVAGVLVTLPFVKGLTLFGEPGRAQALLPSTIIFGVLSLPMLIYYKENTANYVKNDSVESTNLVTLFKQVFSNKALALLLIGYFLYSDTMLTFGNNFPLYLETVHHASDTTKSILTASILLLASVGALIFGRVGDKKGNLRTLKIILYIWCFIFVAMASITNFKILIPVFLFAGILFGPIWGISRALVGEYTPEHLTASSYSYYVVAERFATFVGPMIWSLALISFGEGVAGYRAALFAMTGVLFVSIYVLRKIKV